MAGKRKQKRKQRGNAGSRAGSAPRGNAPVETAHAPPLTPEEAIGAVVAAIVPELFEIPPEQKSAARPEATLPPRAMSPRRGEEHRAHARVAVAVAIGLETESHFFAGLSGDISEGGVFVQTYRDLPVGSDVDVLFELPDGQLTAHGRVRWHRANSDSSPPGVGIAFDELADEERRAIQQFCQSRAPLYYDVEHT
jgi:uncharacterized protein (TIGR02266 family)